MKNYGNMRPVFFTEEPAAYDREKNLVRIGITEATQTVTNEDGELQEVKGWTAYEVEIDRQIDYGHIKSQLVEAAYPPKDEFGFLFNACSALISAVSSAQSLAAMRSAVADSSDVLEFLDMQEWRGLCAVAAKKVMAYFG